MQIQGEATRVTLYLGENDHWQGQPLYLALLQFLRREGASGATVLRGMAGFGAHSRIHTASIVTLSSDLPIVLVWVDTPGRVERLLPQVQQMVDAGLITVEPVRVVQYTAGRGPAPLSAPVQDAMRRDLVSVLPQTPVAEVVTLLIERNLRSVPVVGGDGRLQGIITDGDLLRRARLAARLGLQEQLPLETVRRQLAELQQSGQTAGEIMTHPVITVHLLDTLHTAAARMAEHQLKRLPVVDDALRLVGWISRVDLFRTLDYHLTVQPELPAPGASVVELMTTEVPTVAPTASLETVMQALASGHRQRVVVVDEARRVLGIISDGDLLRRSRQRNHPTFLAWLRGLLGAGVESPSPLPADHERAIDLMTTPVISVHPDTGLDKALHLMLQHNIKRLPVVDGSGYLLGMLGRGSVLRGLLLTMPADALPLGSDRAESGHAESDSTATGQSSYKKPG